MKIYSIKTTLPFSKLAPQTAQNLSSNAFILWCAFYVAGQAQASFDITPQMITKQWVCLELHIIVCYLNRKKKDI